MEGLEAANPGHGSLDPEVVALDPLLQVLGDIVQGSAGQEASFPRCPDGRGIRARRVRADPIRGEQGLILQHLAEEPLGRLQITLCREQEVDRRAMLVDSAVEIAPLAADLDVCLVDAD